MVNMKSVREYSEGMPVGLALSEGGELDDDADRVVLVARLDGGKVYTQVDLEDVIEWLKQNKPEILN